MELAKDYVRHLVHSKSERVSLVLSDTMRSAVWTCFYKIFVDGYQTSFVVCRNCGHILKYTPKDGTTAMRIHMGKFCGRMKAKAVQGTPPTPLVPTAMASGSNGLTSLTPTHGIDEPLDLQKPQLKSPILASTVLHNNNNNNSNHNNNGSVIPGAIEVHSSSQQQQQSPPLTASAGNNGAASQSQFPLSSRPLHPLPIRQMTPTAKAQEILSAFNPIPPSALPTPKMLYLPGCQPPGLGVSSSSSSNTPTSPATVTSGTLNSLSAQHLRLAANGHHQNHHQHQNSHLNNNNHHHSHLAAVIAASTTTTTSDSPCNLVVRRSGHQQSFGNADSSTVSSSSSGALGRVTSDGIEAVAIAFKAALATFDEDLRELDAKIAETETALDKLRSKRLNLLAGREQVNKAARVVLSSVDHHQSERFIDSITINGVTSNEAQPVDAMIDWVRRNSSSESSALKRSAPMAYQQTSSLSNWPQDLQMQFSRGPKRLRKAYTAVRRSVPAPVPGMLSPSSHAALGNASELLNGVIPSPSSKFINSGGQVDSAGAGGSENGASESGVPVASGALMTASDGSSVANTPPSSEYLPPDDEASNGPADCHDDHYLDDHPNQMVNGIIKAETHQHQNENGSDVMMDDSLDGSQTGSGKDSLMTIDCSSILQLQTSTSMFDVEDAKQVVTSATVTNAFVYVGTSSGCVIRYEIGTMSRSLFAPFSTGSDSSVDLALPPSINCMDAWLFGNDNDDDFAILFGTDRGVFRIYNPEFTNVLCEKKLNWPITALRVVPKRRLAFVGLKMGVLVSVDLDKMELAAKIVCGFGSIIDVDWLPSPTEHDDFLLFVATEDGTVSVRDSGSQIISTLDFAKMANTPISRVRAIMADNHVYVVASSPSKRGLVAAQLSLGGETTPSTQIVEICNDDDAEISQFGQLSQNAVFAIDSTGKLSVYRLVDGLEPSSHRLLSQEVLSADDQPDQTPLIHASTLGESCYIIAKNGLVKIFRAIT